MKLTVDNIGFSYTSETPIFQDLSFKMQSGELLCLLGPNGCGKTTLLNCLAGLLKYTSGDVLLDGKPLASMSAGERARNLGYVPQNIVATFDYTVLDYVVTGCAPYMKFFGRPKQQEYDKAAAALEKMGIAYLADKSYARISGGERQMVSIARVLVQEPSFILLDEPTAHLDYGNQVRLLRLVKTMAEEGFGVLMTTHHPDQVLMLDAEVVMMRKDKTFDAGSWRDVINEDSLFGLYGIDVMLEKSEKANRDICVVGEL